MEIKAHARYLRISPRKARSIADIVRGMRAADAIAQLDFADRKAAYPIQKLLRSAVANAEHNFSLDTDSLKIMAITVDGGPVFRRFQPRAFGRAVPIRHRTSHVSVTLEGTRKMKSKKAAPKKIDKTPSPAPAETGSGDEKEAPIQEFTVKKKVGQERTPSFVKRVFRRKAV